MKKFMWYLGFCAFVALSYSIFWFCSDETVVWLTDEDHLYEALQAAFWFFAAIGFFVCYWRGKNVFFLLLGLLFIFGAGEEISWGQRIFNIQTPEVLEKVNYQQETNIHNLAVFNRLDEAGMNKKGLAVFLSFDRLFSLFWFSYCFLVPILSKGLKPIGRFTERIRLPMVPIELGVFFPLNYFVYKYVEVMLRARSAPFHQPSTEVKEFVFAALFLLISLYFVFGNKNRPARTIRA